MPHTATITNNLLLAAAYMPLEVVYPKELLGRVIESSKPDVVITQMFHEVKLPKEQGRILMDGKSWLKELKVSVTDRSLNCTAPTQYN